MLCSALLAISIHAPRVGSDALRFPADSPKSLFLSTLPAWGATALDPVAVRRPELFLSTLPAWGATPEGPQAPPPL